MTEGGRDQREQSIEDEFGLGAVRELLRLISETDITEIQIERGDSKLHIKRGAAQPHTPPLLVAPSLTAAIPPAMHSPLPPVAPFHHPAHVGEPPPASGSGAAGHDAPEPLPAGHAITAPMVGTFYATPSPKDPPYVQEGDTIHAGDRVGIVEAMKMMNEIESEIDGRVARILVKHGQPVEYGQTLMIIEPA